MASDRRSRKRERKQGRIERERTAAELAYMMERIVCDKCGLEQPFRSGVWEYEGDWALAPCTGPLGLPCDSETAVYLDDFYYWHPVP